MVTTLPWQLPLRAAWRDAALAGIAAGASWTIVTNGHSLRVVDCARTWTRQGLEFDLELIMSNPKAIAALWLLCRGRSMTDTGEGGARGHAPFRRSRDARLQRARRWCTAGVATAGIGLRRWLETTSRSHVRSSADRRLSRAVPLVRRGARYGPVMARALSGRLLDRHVGADGAGGKTRGLWTALQAISRLAHAGCQPRRSRSHGLQRPAVLTASRAACRTAADPGLRRRRDADALATESTPTGRRRISYHDLGVEQLGSVYERILEYEPVGAGPAIALSRTSIERKTTGSFYTPRSMTEFLVRRTLAPLAENKPADEILALRVLDPAMGSGAFLVAACRYLADQCERAFIEDGRWPRATFLPPSEPR